MMKLTYQEALRLYDRYNRIEARANKVILEVNMVYLKGKLEKMKDLLRGFSLFASQVSKAMIAIANDVRRVLLVNKDLVKD